MYLNSKNLQCIFCLINHQFQPLLQSSGQYFKEIFKKDGLQAVSKMSSCVGLYLHVGFELINPTGHVTHRQFNIQQLYALPHTVFMCFVFI